jgi:hypothetical protein
VEVFLRKTFARWRLVSFLLILVSAVAQTGQPMPTVTGESLAGHKVVLPDAARGSVAVLIFGFSKASKTPTSAWAKRLSRDFPIDTGFQIYQLPVLEDVPRLFRGMVISGIKKGVPENIRDRFVPILDGEAELKKAVDYREPDDAYLVLLDRNSKVVRQAHGAMSDAAYASLQTEIRSLLAEK